VLAVPSSVLAVSSSVLAVPSGVLAVPSGVLAVPYFITILKFTIFNTQTNKKFCQSKRDLVRYQRLNIALCMVAWNRIYSQPDDGPEKSAETRS
jgi:hypothetical protein